MFLRQSLVAVGVALAGLSFADETITLLHTNDLHAHVEPVKVKGVEIGGYARQATLIRRLRAESTNPLLLNGGDTFQGTLYFNVYHGMADVAFMNQVGYQAMAVGNHEFDRGPAGLADFARLANFPVLAANLDVTEEPLLRDLIKASATLLAGSVKVGVVGAVTPDLPTISSPGDKVRMKDLVPSLQAAIDDLLKQGLDKIVVVSHCGYGEEKRMAQQLKGVDVVVGGHSHTFLGNVKLPGDPRSGGAYPSVVKNADGDTALVVQSWEWGKVFGRLEVTFDHEGKVKAWSRDQPIPVTSEIPEDPTVAAMVIALKKPIEELMNKAVGEALADIPRNGPGKQGAMADMITDAMLASTQKMGSVIALMNAGGVRSALNAGKITYGDAISVQPFNNTLVVLDLTGDELTQALKSGVLYVSKGSSIDGEKVIVAGEPLDPKKTYRCTFNSFIAGGGDGLTVVKDAKGYRLDTGMLDIDALLEYLKTNSPIDPEPQGRIK